MYREKPGKDSLEETLDRKPTNDSGGIAEPKNSERRGSSSEEKQVDDLGFLGLKVGVRREE